MKYKKIDEYITYTPPEEIEICESCPYPTDDCGEYGCAYFREKKKRLQEEKSKKEKVRR